MARPRAEPLEARRRRILEAAKRRLIEKSYGDVRLDEVAREAGIAKGTVYLYFKSKEELLSAVMGDLLDSLRARVDKIPPGDCGRRTLLRLVEEHLEFVDEHKDFLAQVSRQGPTLLRAGQGAPGVEHFTRHLSSLGGRLRACVKAQALRPHEPRLGALFLLSLVRMFMIRKLLYRSKRPLRERAGELLGLYLNGLGAPGERERR